MIGETKELPSRESKSQPETLSNPSSIAIVIATHYPGWYKGELKGELTSDKLRGDLALETLISAKNQGFQIALVDGNSSQEFREALGENAITTPEQQKEKGPQGTARRQGLGIAQGQEGVKVICETEPEKISLVSEALKLAAQPIQNGEADIVVPKRTEEGLSTLPSYQAQAERKANKLYNQILRAHKLLGKNDPDIDFWFGVRVFANKPEIVDLFTKKYEFNYGQSALHQIIQPDAYSNPIFFPIVEALKRRMRVKSVEVPYVHPKQQTEFEEGRPEFDRKRDIQRRAITTELIHLIRKLEKSPKSRLSEEKN